MHCGRLFYISVIEKISEISLHSLKIIKQTLFI